LRPPNEAGYACAVNTYVRSTSCLQTRRSP
jgi:hypothetical protein